MIGPLSTGGCGIYAADSICSFYTILTWIAAVALELPMPAGSARQRNPVPFAHDSKLGIW
jgi:hypothetical protein